MNRSPSAPGREEIATLLDRYNSGRHEEAKTLAQDMTARFPQHALGWKVLGALLKRMGSREQALAPMSRAAALSPLDAETHVNLGIALGELGRLNEAEASYRAALRARPDLAEVHNDLGNIRRELGRLDEAVTSYRMAIQIRPDYAEAHNNLGVALRELGRPDEASAGLRRAIELAPGYAEAHSNLGNVLREQGRLDQAAESYRTATQINPDYADAHSNLAVALKELGRLDEAEAALRRALQIRPDHADAHNNLGVVLHDLGRMDASVASYRRAIQIRPGYAEAHSNLGNALRELGRDGEAEASYRQALRIRPDYAEAHCSLGHVLLSSGRLPEGWKEYEHRWEGGLPKPVLPATSLPQWTGQAPRAGDGIMIFGEQGFGDKLMFSRYLPLVAARFEGRVAVVVNRALLALFRRSFPGVDVLDAAPVDQNAWQWQCPLLSLPLAFDTTLETIPERTPYLVPDPARVAHWRSRIDALDLPARVRTIGIVWKTGSLKANSRLRSLSLQHLAPLLDRPGNLCFSLQKEPDPDRLPWIASGRLVDWSDELGDFDDTAALATNLDLIVSVDTAAAHLAGALGRTTWLLNRFASEWRWMRDREVSPWYPTMRLFTQTVAGDWSEVVARAAAALAAEPPNRPL